MTSVIGTGIRLEKYDRSTQLTDPERKFLSGELPERIRSSSTSELDFRIVQRLIQPFDDVFDYIQFYGTKRTALLLFLLEQMGGQGNAFWGWSDPEWIEVINGRRYDANRLMAVAYLLCGFHP